MGTKHNNSWIDLLPQFIFGAEDDDQGQQQEQEGSENEPEEQEEQQEQGSSDSSALLKALQAERKRAKDAERRAKAAEKAEEERKLAEKSELERAQTELQQRQDANQKLAAALLQRDLKDAIVKAASALNFIDTDDALAGVDRTALSYEQDEDDPTDITIDYKSVERAVKALATKKPHFLKGGTSDGDPTGSGFGGAKQTQQDAEKNYREKYPSLAR